MAQAVGKVAAGRARWGRQISLLWLVQGVRHSAEGPEQTDNERRGSVMLLRWLQQEAHF